MSKMVIICHMALLYYFVEKQTSGKRQKVLRFALFFSFFLHGLPKIMTKPPLAERFVCIECCDSACLVVLDGAGAAGGGRGGFAAVSYTHLTLPTKA